MKIYETHIQTQSIKVHTLCSQSPFLFTIIIKNGLLAKILYEDFSNVLITKILEITMYRKF